MEGYTIVRRGNREYAEYQNTTYYSRRVGTHEWVKAEDLAGPVEPALKLSLIRQRQSFGEPFHWALLVYMDNSTIGSVYQVKGDATLMHYHFAEGVDLFNSQSFHDYFELATLSQTGADWVRYYANREAPPSAPNQAQVSENCQGWAVRVVRNLIQQGIVDGSWYDRLIAMMQPVG